MKPTLRLLALFISCFLWSDPSFAADDLLNSISETDYSIRFLSNIFGVVDGVLHGSGSQIFGAMFGVFNSAVLTLGTTILGYTLFTSTLRTAHEGEALGRNWSSMWIPFKSAMGFALMLPKASGYSMIQIFTMWVVVQGVGAANLIWNTALDYLNSGGAIVQPNTPSLKKSVGLAGDILRSEVCMFMVEQNLAAIQKKDPTSGTMVPSFSDSVTTPTFTNQPKYTGSSPTLTFPGTLKTDGGMVSYKEGKYDGICGSVSWTAASENAGSKQLADARSLAVLQMVTGLVSDAKQIAQDYGPDYDPKTPPTPTKSSLKTLSGTVLKNAGNDYEGIVGPAANIMAQYRSEQGMTSFVDGAKTDGWIMAGSYYQQVVTLNRNYATDESSYPTVKFDYASKVKSMPADMAAISGSDTEAGELINFFSKDSSKSPLAKYIEDQVNLAGDSTGEARRGAIEGYDLGMGVGGQFLAILTSGLSSIIQGFAELWGNTGSADNAMGVFNPVTSAATLGSGLIGLVASIWITGSVTVLGITAAVSFCPAINPMGEAIQGFLKWLMPMLTVLMVTMFALGATLAYYVPLVPYILFLFGGLGWIIGVIESMTAAPLVAVGIMYPEGGHEIMGKAEPAVMLLTNIFIRPSLMVIGFIGGISLSYVGIWLLNAGFARASVAMTAGAQGLAWLFMPLAMMSIYTALVVQIINQAFGLIHFLPDEVLRWVSGGGKQFGEEKGEAAVRGAFKEDMGAVGKGMAEHRKDKDAKEKGGATEKKGGDDSIAPTS